MAPRIRALPPASLSFSATSCGGSDVGSCSESEKDLPERKGRPSAQKTPRGGVPLHPAVPAGEVDSGRARRSGIHRPPRGHLGEEARALSRQRFLLPSEGPSTFSVVAHYFHFRPGLVLNFDIIQPP
ncbi:hypothetical protein MRX96_018263 [Rhipicephalus microplus]